MEKFEACVVKLGPAAQAVMEAARTSPSNSRMVIYGVGGSAQEAMRYSKYGINAIFQEPVERSTALKLVRAGGLIAIDNVLWHGDTLECASVAPMSRRDSLSVC